MADKSKIKEDGRVWYINNIKIQPKKLDAAYQVVQNTDAHMSQTGAWKLFSIRHSSGFPEFIGRWDEKESALDIDRFESAGGKPMKNFVGHHTTQPTKRLRQFEMRIEWPNGSVVLEADISFSITRRFISQAKLGLKFGGSALTVYKSAPTKTTK